MEDLYGIPKFAQMEDITHQDATYRGKEVKIVIDYAFSRLLNTQIELQQWKSGDSLFKDFIDEVSCFVFRDKFIEQVYGYVAYLFAYFKKVSLYIG